MYKNLITLFLNFFIIEIVSNQSAFNVEKIWYNKDNKRIEAPDSFPDNYLESLEKPRSYSSNILTNLKAFIRDGLCVSKCIFKHLSNCREEINCVWSCLSQQKDDNIEISDEQNDDEIVVLRKKLDSSPDTESDSLTSKDIVHFFICFSKCMTKYLPFNRPRLKQFIVCLSYKCICYGR